VNSFIVSRIDYQRVVQGVISEPVETYMTDLHHRLQQAADWARLHAEYGQLAYAHQHIRFHDKTCWKDDTVIVVDVVATSKLCKVARTSHHRSCQVKVNVDLYSA